MEKISVNGIEIYIINGNKYIKRGNEYKNRKNGKFDKLCKVDDCYKKVQYKKIKIIRNTDYCRGHLKKITDYDPSKLDQLINSDKNEKNKKKIRKEEYKEEQLNKNKIIINDIEIYIINNKKYRLNHKKYLSPACSYENCNKFANNRTTHKYCASHINGTDPNSIERQIELANRKKFWNQKNNPKMGNDAEQWLFDIMHLFNSINSIKKIGNICHKLDIIYKINNEHIYRGIQVKTIGSINNNSYYISNIKKGKYNDDTLIVGFNRLKNRFILTFSRDLIGNNRTFNFSNNNSIYKQFMYTNLLEFLNQLEKLLGKSTIYNENDITTNLLLRQKESFNRLENKCNQLNLSYRLFDKSYLPIDCTINNYNIQCKTTNYRKIKRAPNTYNVHINKSNRKKNTKKPYSDKDGIDFFIIEIIDYPHNFYIIPIKEMIKQKLIQTNNQKGKMIFGLPKPNHNPNHWTTKYLNNFDQLKTNEFYELLTKMNPTIKFI